jgi:phage shock protein PspC (stress-responsive transcriptional regulator)
MNELRRTKDGIIGGVCGGFANWIGIDQTLVRIIFAILALGCGVGVGFYILCWILMPEED